MLWLRILTCCGLIFGIVFFTCQPMPLYGPVFWHAVFLLINLYQIRRLVLDRRQLMLSREQEELSREMFENLSREELVTLLTRSMLADRRGLHISEAQTVELSEEERVLRAIAFDRLSRGELMNLLTRRMWASMPRLRPRWRRGQNRTREDSAASLSTMRVDA
jgi:hypothetical protein